jgi:hypothetical protein
MPYSSGNSPIHFFNTPSPTHQHQGSNTHVNFELRNQAAAQPNANEPYAFSTPKRTTTTYFHPGFRAANGAQVPATRVTFYSKT